MGVMESKERVKRESRIQRSERSRDSTYKDKRWMRLGESGSFLLVVVSFDVGRTRNDINVRGPRKAESAYSINPAG